MVRPAEHDMNNGSCCRYLTERAIWKIWIKMGLILKGLCSPLLTCVLNSHLKRLTIPDAVLIQFDLLRMSITVLETCREMISFGSNSCTTSLLY